MLRIYDVVLEIITDLRPFLAELKRKSPKLRDEMECAPDSTVLAIAEGSRSRGKNRFVHYARGAASMDEAIACPDAAVAHGYIAPLNPVVREKMKRVVGTLVICSR
jgi:hypothetical protein